MVFLFCNYILLGAASSCIFLILSLWLFLHPLQVFTIAGAISGCAAVGAIVGFGFRAVFTRTRDFLG
ncbi:hypothetical protein VNO80_25070 [Phaseolus coccineus]|uniref:Uncharacterized protein n=1 Tax=Phaseolus coccineus TaxID=3886 RepID=A0AAN9LYG1_PHACN